MQLTLEQIHALAPDASAIKAGQKLGAPKSWKNTGQNEAAVWGECQGSALYQVRVDCSDWAYKCSCPSRKLPCKHVLGLLTLAAQSPDAVPNGEAPEWVTHWLGRRAVRAEQKATKAAEPPKSKDDKAAAKRREQRLDRINDGVAQLNLWMEDLVRNGLANVVHEGFQLWEKQAARLVDAQAPGLAARVRELGGIPGSGKDWPARLLAGMGRLALLTHAWQRLDSLDPALAADVRQHVGLPVSEEERLAQGEVLTDEWMTLGQWIDSGDRIRTRRTWMKGLKTGRVALVLHFAVSNQPFGQILVPGMQQSGTLRFWPGAFPMRAEASEMTGDSVPIAQRPPGAETIEQMFDEVASALSRQPWLDRFLVGLYDVVPTTSDDGAWHVLDRQGAALRLAGGPFWQILATSGGRPLDVFGEWNGRTLRLLGTWADGQFRIAQEEVT